jgi:hypothetical protein
MTLSSRLTVPLCFVYVEMALLWILAGNHKEEEEENPIFFRVGERETKSYDIEAESDS